MFSENDYIDWEKNFWIVQPTKINKLKKAKLNSVKALFITMLLSIKKIKNKNRS